MSFRVFRWLNLNFPKRFLSTSSRITLESTTANFRLKAAVTTSAGLPEKRTPLIQTLATQVADARLIEVGDKIELIKKTMTSLNLTPAVLLRAN